jgi:hypothetical protein
MAGSIDSYTLEKQIGSEAASKLRNAFRSAIRETVNVRGESRKASVTARYKQRRLDRLTFAAPYYIFMQHNGFEGQKKNGVMMRLKATDVLNKALQQSGVLENLADNIANLRGEEVIASINLPQNGR